MIIKSMSRKEASFNQLLDYMRHGANREDDKYSFNHNCFGRKNEDIIREFEEQASRLSKRKNGVFLYHEILSISRSKLLAEEKQKEILTEIVQEYIQKRAKDHMVCGYMHDEKNNNLHFHLLISSNEVGKTARHSLRKKQFSDIKTGLEKWVLDKYPEIEQKKLISKDNHYRDKKEAFKDRLQSIFSTSISRDDLHQKLAANKVEYKIRGKTITFINLETKKRHRLKTLGILQDYEDMAQRFEQENKEPNNKTEKENKVRDKKQDTNSKTKQPKSGSSDKKYSEVIKEGVANVANEWVLGDFKERDSRIKKANNKKKYKEKNERNAQIKDTGEQNYNEILEESADEWLFGDFSAREERERREKLKRQNREDEKVKDSEQQSNFEKTVDVFKEWGLGDFSAREARARNEVSKENIKQWRDKKEKSQSNDKSKKGKSK